jgi:glutamate synthase domain-containing protein 1
MLERKMNNLFNDDYIKREEEGGCGVIGTISTIPLKGKYLIKALFNMQNRGNGKGGGISLVGLNHEDFNISKLILETCYIINVAYLDIAVQKEVESILNENFYIEHVHKMSERGDLSTLGLEVKPPTCILYFARPKQPFDNQISEDQFVFKTSSLIDELFYAGKSGNEKAFVVSNGKNMLIFKLVGYAQQVILYYGLEEIAANSWIGHHRYPTKGNVWHPGGAHPFKILNHALIHNGDFANYAKMIKYLKQFNLKPYFRTDTEAAALIYYLYNNLHKYPLEYLIEALAPTSEHDYTQLTTERQKVYNLIQQIHKENSPDGPWFFIINGNNHEKKELELIGITDTSMLRPQIFSLYKEDSKQIAIISSEYQVTLSFIKELRSEGIIQSEIPDFNVFARGGSYTDGGAFKFSLNLEKQNNKLEIKDKFGNNPLDKRRKSIGKVVIP